MSLINDALKRAQEQKQRTAEAPKLSAPLQPVERLRRPSRTPQFLIPVVFAVIACAGVALMWFWWQGKSKAPVPPANGNVAVVTPVAPPPAVTPKPVVTPIPSVIVQMPQPVAPKPVPAINTPPTPPPNVAPTPVVAPVVTPSPPVAEKPAPNVVAVAEPAPQPTVTPQPPAPAPPPTFPDLRLQGIFYRPSNPSALINSKTVFVGDEIAGVKVVAIERTGVKVELDGHTKTVKLQ